MVLLSAAAAVAPTASAIASQAATSTVATGTLQSLVTSGVPSMVASALPSVTTTVPVTAAPLVLPPSFEVAAIFVGALSGALIGVNRKFDITGVVVLALVNGLGGGIMRDLLLQDMGIFAFENPRALYAVVAAALTAAFFYSIAARLKRAALIVDTASLALFCIVGSDKGLRAGLAFLPAILVGVITSVGGGVARDMLVGEVPQVMRRGSLTATAAAAGSFVYVTMVGWLEFEKWVALAAAGTVAFLLRAGSLYFGWQSPEPLDLTPVVVSVPGRFLRTGRRLVRAEKPPAVPGDETCEEPKGHEEGSAR